VFAFDSRKKVRIGGKENRGAREEEGRKKRKERKAKEKNKGNVQWHRDDSRHQLRPHANSTHHSHHHEMSSVSSFTAGHRALGVCVLDANKQQRKYGLTVGGKNYIVVRATSLTQRSTASSWMRKT
jgi:hypothetical protein